MARISWNEIQDRAEEFASKWDGETYEKGESQSFWSDFLDVFGIDRRRHGAYFEYAVKKASGAQGFIDMFWPGKLLAEQKSGGRDLGKAGIQAYEYLDTMPDHDLPQAIVVSDFTTFQFIDLSTRDKVEFALKDFPKQVKLFGFLLGEGSKHLAEEDPVNRKAAEAMARLHNQLQEDNFTGHDLEVLLVRLVFCLFADDSGIFEHGALRDYLETRTNEDGSDFGPRLMQVFQALNMPEENRQASLDEEIAGLPYVNGGLFAESISTPYFTSTMRRDLLKTMELDWSRVSPAIFGSMFQGVMDEKQRRNLGAHYTSEKNILRVIKPLFLDGLYDEFAAIKRSPKKLKEFHEKIADLKFLDPACGCGNFLVITYRELRRLEHKVVLALQKGNKTTDMMALAGEGAGALRVNVDQMYGIEIEEFPSLIAQTALWLTDHQMNVEYSHASGKTFKRIPLKSSATIVHANALTKDWVEVVAPKELNYILGNPPFIGSKMMTGEQRQQLLMQADNSKNLGVVDFVAGWYFKAAQFMHNGNKNIKTALVSTNSITQGEQVALLWKYLLEEVGVTINFAHQTFKWSNDAKGNAAVYCVIVGFSFDTHSEKRIFQYPDIKGEPVEVIAGNVNGYLIDAPNVFIERHNKPICKSPQMTEGITALDGGRNLRLSESEKDELILVEPGAAKWIKPWITGQSLLGNERLYCLWLADISPSELRAMPKIIERVEKVRTERLSSTYSSKFADRPWTFRETIIPKQYIVFPKTSSENRTYIPLAFVSDSITSNTCLILPGSNLYHFGLLISQMHMAWMRVVAGRLKSDYRYSKDIVYNNFVWPEVSDVQKAEVERLAQGVLDSRAKFPEASLADLYDPLAMPPELSKAHKALDRAVDKLYRKETFKDDAERVARLFKLYQEKTTQ